MNQQRCIKLWDQSINISEEKISQVTKTIGQEHENPIHLDKEKLVNIISGGALDDDIGESILNMVDVVKSRMEDFKM